MNNVYVVMSSEQVDDLDNMWGSGWFDEPCRAFDSSDEADKFMITLINLHKENKDYENTTRFYVMRVPFGAVSHEEDA